MSTTVGLALDTTLVSPANGREMARMYLPDDDIGNRWTLEKITWIPSNASLAALPFPVVPDTDAIGEAPPVSADGPAAYYAQVVLADIPPEINPGEHPGLGFIGGTLNGATLRIRKRRVTVEIAIARRIPNVFVTNPDLAITYQDVEDDFPAITFDDVDPDVSYYDVRLVHP